MKGEEQRMPLPEELVEKIIAMVPFPQIFKARALSKSWHARLASISSHGDEEKEILAVSFQKRVCEWSDNWKTFCPVYLFDKFLSAYDPASQHWRRIPFLSALPDLGAMTVNSHLLYHRVETSVVGALDLFTSLRPGIKFVVNIFTGSWKDLPPLPRTHRRWITQGRLVSSKETYKVIRLYTAVGRACAWIYESKLGVWRRKRLEIPEILKDFKVGLFDVYLNGVLYVTVHVEELVWSVLAFDVEEETFSLIQMPAPGSTSAALFHSRPLVACNGTVYIVEPKGCGSVVLLEVDFVRRRWSQAILHPPPSFEFKYFSFSYRAAGHGDYLFFHGTGDEKIEWSGKVVACKKVVAYNVRNDEWNSVARNAILQQYSSSLMASTLSSAPFEPGMNPFLEV